MSLDQVYIVRAQNELSETEELKAQSLTKFRQWIAQHDYFANCRQGKTLESDDVAIVVELGSGA